ncbi:MAG: hypothetical protein A3C70_01985 [Candidatus Zambryskibacteria bacterium RIFCSPHIGHO2_02_FULL_43_14]|uniref:Major facilitator superfamily (MFS) profile domain-containing protein n=1 Tax=Candidatus Zambryskibacteria bacterium RIFCSPHIGHO2_02_FULL_43_14 TaxID=1802748 RepID=A0A1G2THH5_9BACT|nr:MAG: hypothetical protein A2829_01680 [Candidatus Zambryskibacteria bacterium RIFCSPHIGHO2_01_FULL_43_60]OHA96652.1 MAG: hypothetical protein A3C70_01985 [Candidatus Zambryskibacteria bacterium RIFCSPHIGHO2_02_FULL_43_14]OHB04006.1 MAG: hypothetical protein A3B03_00925 [Candidatus Zambryskibacteria bacterium RIFCSPLOWO2_01_FULL_42_41]
MIRFAIVLIITFFVSLHWGAILYVNSSLLSNFFTPDIISIFFLLGGVGNVILFLLAPKLIERLGKHRLLLSFLILAAVSTLNLAWATTEALVAISFIIYASTIYMIFYCFDIFLEELSTDTKTGEIRGIYIATIHLGLILGLFMLTVLAIADVLKYVYIAATVLLVPPILFTIFSLKTSSPTWHGLHRHHALLPFGLWWRTRSIRRATLARFSLEFFYTFMTIYAPLYLHSVLGFEWNVIGTMFIVMLLPFIFFQWPVGKLADHFIGEKELMIIGFLLMIVSLLFMPYLEAVVIVWTLALLLSRVGASLVEITTDSYFFKHISAYDIRLLSIFRLTRPASIVLGTAVGAISLNIFSFEKIFFVLALVVFFGLKESLLIKDTL